MSENKNYHRIVYYVAIVVLFILFIVLLNTLPFPDKYRFGHFLGVGAAVCLIGLIVYALMLGIVEKLIKILVELAGAVLLFINAAYGAVCWAFFNEIKMSVFDFFPDISDKLIFITIVLMVLALLIFNFFAMLILYPLSNLTGANIVPLDEMLEG